MTAAWVQSKGVQSGGAVATVTVTLNGVVSGNHLNACCQANNVACSLTTSTPSATWANAVADFVDGGAATAHLRADYTESVASGTWNITATPTGGSEFCAVTASESSGVATSGSLGAVNHGTSSGATTTVQPGSITPTAGSVVYTGVTDVASSGTSADTINSSFTVDEIGGANTVWDDSAGVTCGTAHLNNVAATPVNPTWTDPRTGINGQGALIMEFKASSVGLPPGLGPSMEMDPASQSAQASMMR